MLIIVAMMKVQPGNEAQFEELMSKMAAQTRQEAGNRRYQLFRSVEEPSTYLLYEKYDDKAALEAHGKSAHFREIFLAHIRSLMAGRVEVEQFQPAE